MATTKEITNARMGIEKKELRQDLVKPHIDSFNYFLREGIRTMTEFMLPEEFETPNGDRCSLFVKDIRIDSPRLPETNTTAVVREIYPSECRERRSTYKGDVTIMFGWKSKEKLLGVMERNVGQLPIMLKSDACNLNQLGPKELIRRGEDAEELGGYYVVNGMEKVTRMVNIPRRNFPLCTKRKTWTSKNKGFTEYGLTIRCVRPDQTGVNMRLHFKDDDSIQVCIAYRRKLYYLPLMIVLKALLDVSDQYICSELMAGNEDDQGWFKTILLMLQGMHPTKLFTRKEVRAYIGNNFRIKTPLPKWYTDEEVGEYMISQCICVHLKTDRQKFDLMVYMVKKLYHFTQNKCLDESPDNPMNHELLLSGHLIQALLKDKLEAWLTSLRLGVLKVMEQKGLTKATDLDEGIIGESLRRTHAVTRHLEYLLATGNLNTRADLGFVQSKGLCVIAERINLLQFMSHFRAVHRGATFAEMRDTRVRRLAAEYWGFICPTQTPDGALCGILNHLSATCQVVNTVYPTKPILAQMVAYGMIPMGSILPVPLSECYEVLMDGELVGHVPDSDASKVVSDMRVDKLTGQNGIPPELEICLVQKTNYISQYPGLFLFSSVARMVRPVINLQYRTLELIGIFEQVYMDIAINTDWIHNKTTHVEPDFCNNLSMVALLTPYADQNPSPRNIYQCQMGKQTMGTPVHSYRRRADNKLYHLQTPQTPICRTQAYDNYQIDDYPMGVNAVVAVKCETGYEMEDAIVINKASFERGLAGGCIIKSIPVDLKTVARMKMHDEFIFGNDGSIEGLDSDGLPPIGQPLNDGDPFYSYINLLNGETKVEYFRTTETAYVEQVKLIGSENGNQPLHEIVIMIRIKRNPKIGDKFSSRHGQKGILSMLWPPEDLPFTSSGITPDIIFNPHGFPSRMTIGMMVELMAGKAGAIHGLLPDATTFTFSDEYPAIDHFGKMLLDGGFHSFGEETMIDGESGRTTRYKMFTGVVYYQRLRHMVNDKFQVRSTGPVDPITQQPVKGRKNQGGIRFGEMERDCLISHGCSFLLQDRFMDCSDGAVGYLCKVCGSLISPLLEKAPSKRAAVSYFERRRWTCLLCKGTDSVVRVSIPYTLRYLCVELAAMRINMKIETKSRLESRVTECLDSDSKCAGASGGAQGAESMCKEIVCPDLTSKSNKRARYSSETEIKETENLASSLRTNHPASSKKKRKDRAKRES